MTQNMSKVKYLRIIFILLALFMGAASETLAQTNNPCTDCSDPKFSIATSDIIITGSGDVSVTGIVHNTEAGEHNGEHTVTIKVEPDDGYCIKKGDIRVQKLVAPSSRSNPTRRNAPEIADDLTVNGPSLVIHSTVNNTFTFTVPAGYDGAYIEAEFKTLDDYSGTIITEGGITYNASGHYIILDDIDVTTIFAGTQSTPFTGTFEGVAKEDGSFPKITGLTSAIFQTVGAPNESGGTVKNIVLDNVEIGGSTTVTVGGQSKTATGAIANVAQGSARIYNCGILATESLVTTDDDGYTRFCTSKDANGAIQHETSSSTVGASSTDYVGGLVGFLDGTARVINCYSYADVAGKIVGGIVGRNNIKTASNNLKTMVMNCMFYGNLLGKKDDNDKAPIYNGEIISNAGDKGVGNYNYFYSEAPYAENLDIQTANCALMAEGRFLQRFEFFRHLLNSHRELAGWWATGTYSKTEMAKWVLEPSQIGSATPYPILKTHDKYPSVVNIDAEHATTQTERNKGGKLGTLTVYIQMGNGAVYTHPGTGDTEAKITTSQLPLNITDKDPDHFNFNYYKVQLPYYNDVGTKNYTGNRVVTGWKIVKINGSEEGTGTYTTGADVSYDANDNLVTPYNFADRNCTNKDLYSESKRVFNQGAYWDVPEGVISITIEPYWAKCVYLADPNADKVYNTGMGTGYDVSNVGGGAKYSDGNSYTIAGESQVVYTSMSTAISSSTNPTGLYVDIEGDSNDHTVYDYAVVLVGNYHHIAAMEASNSKPYTVTSIDLDGDNEPDYSYILRFNGRTPVHPVRADFINIPGLGMAQKSTGGTGSYNFGILQPKNFFESTNTSLFRVTQFEYDAGRDVEEPFIVQGGVFEQWVGGQQTGHKNKITYFHVGGNVWFKEFHRGCHQDKQHTTKHPPVSVTGGDYDEFYLTGLYRGDVNNYEDNAECYINGGRFGIVCGAAMEGIGKANGANNTGNITWQIQNADIDEFYAGGLNAASGHTVTGNLSTTITGGYIGIYCGGPKFGDMSSGKTVTTTATGCTFGTFFGAGYGGNSYSREAPYNHNNIINFPHTDNTAGYAASWNDWLDDFYKQAYNPTYGGVSTQFSYQFLPMSGNVDNVARIFVEYVKFSLATTHSVTSTLTGCTINNNFYGGGSLGKVDGNVTSTLINCTVKGNVFGAGFSAKLPDVVVDAIGFETEPYYYENFGTYLKGVKYEKDPVYKPTTYTWKPKQGDDYIDTGKHELYTTENLDKSNLGSVQGNVTLTIQTEQGKTTTIGTEGDSSTGNVFGGGEQSYVINTPPATSTTSAVVHTVTVNLKGPGTTNVLGNVFGGGDQGKVEGSTVVNVED